MYIKAKVKTGVKREFFKQKDEDHFEIAVKEKAERNLANKRVIEFVAGHFEVSVKNIRIISGHQKPSKILRVDIQE